MKLEIALAYSNHLRDGTRWVKKYGSFKFRVGYRAWGLIWAKSSFPAIRNRTVRIVAKRL